MLSERLREIMERIERLSEQEQDHLAAIIAADMDEEAHWQAAMDDPHNLELDRLLSEAREQVARGEARDLDELL